MCNRLLLVTSALDLPLRTNTLCSVIFSLAFTDRWRSLCRKQTCTNCYTLVHRRPSIVDRAVLQSSIDSQLFVPNCDLCLPHLHSTPPLGGPVDIAMTFAMEKLKCFGYRMVKIFWRYDYSFWQNSRTWQIDGRTDGQTPHNGIGRACIVSRGKHVLIFFWDTVCKPRSSVFSGFNIWEGVSQLAGGGLI